MAGMLASTEKALCGSQSLAGDWHLLTESQLVQHQDPAEQDLRPTVRHVTAPPAHS